MKKFFSIILCFFSLSAVFGQDVYKKGLFISNVSGDTLQYRFLEPENPKSGKKYPLVIFLHGSGERGTDNEAQLRHGGGQFLNPVNREKYPSFVIFPQCGENVPEDFLDSITSLQPEEMPENPSMTPTIAILKELLDSYIARADVDERRVYIIGLSMGGMGTFEMVSRYPEMFAAAVPICGSVNPERVKRAKDVSFRIFHGDADPAVTVRGSREAYKALKSVGADVEYIEFPGCTHNSWNPAFNYPDFLQWIYKQKK